MAEFLANEGTRFPQLCFQLRLHVGLVKQEVCPEGEHVAGSLHAGHQVIQDIFEELVLVERLAGLAFRFNHQVEVSTAAFDGLSPIVCGDALVEPLFKELESQMVVNSATR